MADLLEDHLVILIDLLGFGESTSHIDSRTQKGVLDLLRSIASLRSEFNWDSKIEEWGSVHNVAASVSTFSDHIVMSLPLARMQFGGSSENGMNAAAALLHLYPMVRFVATTALELGFLIRGSMVFGKLYHAGGVVFGPALIEAVAFESKSAVYPRVVISEPAAALFGRTRSDMLTRDFDGMLYLNFYLSCVIGPERFSNACELVGKSLRELTGSKRAKWFYFAQKLTDACKQKSIDELKHLQIDLAKLPKLD